MILSLFITLCSLGGFAISAYIYQTVQRKKTLTCPIGHTCDSVVHSKYGETFGIKNTLLGMLYYGLIACFYSFILFGVTVNILYQDIVMLIITSGAFCFSMYLIYIQAIILKEWCSWCVFTAILTTGIFVAHLIPLI